MAKRPGIPITLNNSVPHLNVPDDIVWTPDEPMIVNGCSGHISQHATNCDGMCKPLQLDELDIKIENEKRAWARLGMQTQHYTANALRQDVTIAVLVDIVKEAAEVDDDAFNELFKTKMLGHMTAVRINSEDSIKSARARSSIVLPGGPVQ